MLLHFVTKAIGRVATASSREKQQHLQQAIGSTRLLQTYFPLLCLLELMAKYSLNIWIGSVQEGQLDKYKNT